MVQGLYGHPARAIVGTADRDLATCRGMHSPLGCAAKPLLMRRASGEWYESVDCGWKRSVFLDRAVVEIAMQFWE